MVGVTTENTTPERTNHFMMTTTETPTPPGEIVLFAQVGSRRITFTARQLRDTVASYLARGGRMPTPTQSNDSDPFEPFHIIAEEWLYGNVQAWIDGADIAQLTTYRHHAMTWLRSWSRWRVPELEALN